MKRLKQLLEKLKMYINKLIKKENVLLIKGACEKESMQINDSSNDEDSQKDKKEFFELYQNVKAGNIVMENLMINDLIKVMSMMQQEIDIHDEKIGECETEILSMDAEIKMLEKDNQIMNKTQIS